MPDACRITDPSHCPACSHGCPKCPHDVTGPATSGSVNVLINGIYALRKQDRGRHASCCGENSWEVTDGAPGVFINGRNAARVGDPVEHCGGNGQLSGGSGNVVIGNYKKGDGPPELPYCGGFELEDEHGELLPFTRYVIRTSDGKEHEGRSDHRGQTCLVFTDAEDDLEVEILPDDCTDYEEPEG